MKNIANAAECGNHKTLPPCNFLSAEQERSLIARWQKRRDLAARLELVEAFRPLLYREAARFVRGKGLKSEVINKPGAKSHEQALSVIHELAAVGMLGLGTARGGLFHAIDKFDLAKPFRFSTYAMQWIQCSLREWHRLECQKGIKGAPRRATFINQTPIHTILGVDEGGVPFTLGDTIADDHDFSSSSEVESESAALHERIATELDACERRIIEARHLDIGKRITLDRLGEELGFSGEWARQKEARAMEKLRESRLLARSGPCLWPVTHRWNAMGLDKPVKRFPIPTDILKLAETEPCKPDWWRQPPPCSHLDWAWQRIEFSGRCYSRKERQALVTARPDLLLRNFRSRRDWESWHSLALRSANTAIRKPSGRYRFKEDGPPPYQRWPRKTTATIIPFRSRQTSVRATVLREVA